MKDPAPILKVPPKLRAKIVKIAKRLAFIESNLFARIFRLDEHMARVKTFLKRNDIEPDTRKEAEQIKQDLSALDPRP